MISLITKFYYGFSKKKKKKKVMDQKHIFYILDCGYYRVNKRYDLQQNRIMKKQKTHIIDVDLFVEYFGTNT